MKYGLLIYTAVAKKYTKTTKNKTLLLNVTHVTKKDNAEGYLQPHRDPEVSIKF